MGRQAIAARYRHRSGAHLRTHLKTLVICQFGRQISGPAITDLPGSDGSFDISRDVGAYVGSWLRSHCRPMPSIMAMS